jgi:hypothetical protein
MAIGERRANDAPICRRNPRPRRRAPHQVRDYETDSAHELDAYAVALLRDAVTQRFEAERYVVDAVRAAGEASNAP